MYTSPAVIAIPHWVPLLPATSCTRCPSVSAIYRFPPADSTPCGEPKGADAAGPPFPLLVPSPSRVYRFPGTGLPVASDDAQLSVHPYPSGPGVPAWVCCPASFASYVRVKPSDGPNPGTEMSVAAWVKSPFAVFTGSPALACATPGAAGFEPPIVAPAGTSPPVEGASACVAALIGAPSSTYGCPTAPLEAVKSAGVAAAS